MRCVIRPAFLIAVSLTATACASQEGAPEAEGAPETTQAAVSAADLYCRTSADEASLAERPSPLDSVTFTVGDTPAKLCYGRPSTRGRVMVGELDPFDAPWRMGANEPTTLHLGGPAMVGGVHLDAGSYALYAIPREDAPWTVVINGNPDRWGVPINDEVRAADIGSFDVEIMPLDEPVETLTFVFEPAEEGGSLVFSFESRSFSIPVSGH